MLRYPALFEPDRESGGFVVTFPDFPFGVTQGDSFEEANEMAQDLLATLLADRMKRRLAFPKPGKIRGNHMHYVSLPPLAEAKAALYQTMRRVGVRKADLARSLGCPKSSVDRLLDFSHASRLEQIDQAFRVLGKRLIIDVRNAA